MASFEVEDPLINGLIQYISQPKFQSTFENFFLNNALKFTDDEEHKLEYMEIYQDFQALFDDAMKGFLEEEGVSEAEFSRRCREAIDRDERAGQYVKIIIASMDYDAFVGLMKVMRHRAKSERAESKNVEASREKRKQTDDDDEIKEEKAFKSESKEQDDEEKQVETEKSK